MDAAQHFVTKAQEMLDTHTRENGFDRQVLNLEQRPRFVRVASQNTTICHIDVRNGEVLLSAVQALLGACTALKNVGWGKMH